MSVRQAQEDIDSAEFSEWIAFDKIEPFGEQRADLRAGIVSATMANMWSKGKRLVPADFMPTFDQGHAREQQSIGDMKARLLAAAKGKINHGDTSKSVSGTDGQDSELHQGVQQSQADDA